jgi:hypothetical protein
VTGSNDIGWLSWSWGGLPNGHCVPNFDHTFDGIFGKWRTTYAEEMMVGHPHSLMQGAERPASFYEADSVTVSGIYLGPDISAMTVGDTQAIEVLVAPANAWERDFAINLSGDTGAVSLDPVTGRLAAVKEGMVTLEAISVENSNISFTREIEIQAIPVTSITITPSAAQLEVGDTLYLQVEVLPEDATEKGYTMVVLDSAGVIHFDSSSSRVLALQAGSAQIEARWIGGDVTGTIDVTVSAPVGIHDAESAPVIQMYPNPNSERSLHVSCSREIPLHLKIVDLAGNLMIESHYTGSTTIDTSNLPPGTYLVIHTGNDLIFKDKLITL